LPRRPQGTGAGLLNIQRKAHIVLRRFRLTVVPLVAVAGLLVASAVSAAPSARPEASARPARLSVGVEVLRFGSHGRVQKATGVVTAKLTDSNGQTKTIQTQVALTASTGGGCNVLHLYLKELTLHLLGLDAHLDPVTLDITGNANGGVLGSLFCKLAHAKAASARAADAQALTAAVHRHGGAIVRFNAFIHPVAAASQATAVCPVLDLVVGPLDLQLLGLVVDLQRVHLTITATRNGGALGDVFCKLADNSTTTTSSTTT
jgi:hypothetical protein